jgi:hypothetical protein
MKSQKTLDIYCEEVEEGRTKKKRYLSQNSVQYGIFNEN